MLADRNHQSDDRNDQREDRQAQLHPELDSLISVLPKLDLRPTFPGIGQQSSLSGSDMVVWNFDSGAFQPFLQLLLLI
jgi:hypothetical protein